MKLIVIGGVASGTSAAARATRVNPDVEVTLYEKDDDISYAGCGLPYYISGVVEERSSVIINTPEKFSDKYGINLKTSHEVTKIDPENKEVHYKDLVSGETGTDSYDSLIIATGATPIMPPIPGIELENILPLRTVNHADRHRRLATNSGINKVTIVGAGLIGMEMSEAYIELGLDVTVVEKQKHILPLINSELSEKVENHCRDKGVEFYLEQGVIEFKGEGKAEKVILDSGEEVETDMVLMAIGVRPVTGLAAEAGIELGVKDSIKVNGRMETNLEDIWACGDCVQSVNLVSGHPAWVPLGSTANKQGRVAGENAVGGNNFHRGILGTGITKVFDYCVATTGIKEDEAEAAGYDPVSVTIKAPNHSGYYPGFEYFSLQGIFDKKSGRILGAEGVGRSGVDKRMDVLSTAIYAEQTADDLFQIDLGYAPPYSVPKDPVAILGMVAQKKI
ncbi:MAG: FAD-dependent oxidoreductase [Bacillota bacterium]